MKAGYALAALLCCAPSAPVETGPGTPHFAGMPPERFMREDVAVVLFVKDVGKFCGTAPEGLTLIACVREVSDRKIIFMPHPALYGENDFYARIMAHELAHVAGWTANHEL
ncbi:hypothetical protein [Tsuneonella sp. HG222]